jgi:periplasmic copper chaperone A
LYQSARFTLARAWLQWNNPRFWKDAGMTFPLRWLAFIGFASFCSAAAAQPVTVNDAWVRAPAPGQKVAGAYMELTSKQTSFLVSVASPAAGAAELHITTLDGGIMKMRPVSKIELAGGKPVKLAPSGVHVMLLDLKQPLKPGDKVPLTLTVQRDDRSSRSVFTVQAVVREGPPEKANHHQH